MQEVYLIQKTDQFENVEIRVFKSQSGMLAALRKLADENVTADDDITGMCPEAACMALMDSDSLPSMQWGPWTLED